jgi:hypothetical protein
MPLYSMYWEDKWDYITGYWNPGIAFVAGDAVNNYWTGNAYKCILAHTSTTNDEPETGGNWQTYWEVMTSWQGSTNYTIGDLASMWLYDHYRIYRCKSAHYSSNYEPGMSMDWTTAWEEIITTITWQNEIDFITDDVVYAPDYNFYICTADHRSSNHYPGMAYDWQTFWENISVQNWSSYTNYVVGNRVSRYNGTSYDNFECIYDHTADSSNEPIAGADWQIYWKRLPKAVICISSHTSGGSTEPYWGAAWTDKWIPTPWLADGYYITTPASYNWYEFISLCNDLNYGGFSDWRMPNLYELIALMDYSLTGAMISSAYATNLQSVYWTSTAYANYGGYAWAISATDGAPQNSSMSAPYSPVYCLPVRSL